MQVFVKSFSGRTFTLDVEPSDTIYQVKQKIGIKEQVSASQQRLLFSGCQLEDSKTISNSNIASTEAQPTLQVLLRLKGGGFTTLHFNSLTDQISRKFVDYGPEWLSISHGLNLEGICTNSKCEAYNQWVCVPIGFGKFNMAMVVHKAQCPMCGKFCKKVENMSLFQARCESVGMVQGEMQERKVRLIQEKTDEYLTFEDRDETKLNWLYLQIEVRRL